MSFGRSIIWCVLLVEAFVVAFIDLGLAIFLPAVSGSKIGSILIFLAAIIYFVAILAAMRSLRLGSRRLDIFAALIAAPPVLYYGSMLIMISIDQWSNQRSQRTASHYQK